MTDLVIDASIAIKWVVSESGTAEALSLRRRNRLYAPELLAAECANVLWRKVRLKELAEEEAAFAARLLQRADIELMPMRPLLEPAMRLAIALDHPAYDCVYLALAESLSCDLVTADERFAARPLSAGVTSKVLLLTA
ncbi:MAG TPA: type II toxin-antitoxin system VapC family toxin [Stellaceae bacterium]|nr:type II toxin-antitoxin system VapC family toxin [Stellaceae bacterium]